MGFGADQLRDKALLALEEAVVECRYRKPGRSFAIRFALAYLYAAHRPQDRAPFDNRWLALGQDHSPWSFTEADGALLAISVALGLRRDGSAAMRLWEQRDAEERG